MTKLSEQIKELASDGKSYREIQSILGCSKGTISYHLGEGQVEKNRQRRQHHRNTIRDYFRQVKQDSVCADCKENYPYWMMDFDHLGDKEFGIASFQARTQSLEVIKKEIAKCEVVCANCHRNRTYLRSRSKSDAEHSAFLDINSYYE